MTKLTFFVLFLFVVGALVPFPDGSDGLLWTRLFDAGHYPGFFLLVLVVVRELARRGYSEIFAAYLAGAIGIFLVVAVEVVQPYFGRSFGYDDIVAGALGVITAVLLARSLANSAMRWRSAPIKMTLSLFVVASIYFTIPAWRQYQAYRWRSAHFPVIAHGSEYPELGLWSRSTSEKKTLLDQESAGAHTVGEEFVIRSLANDYSGIKYFAGDFDWSTYALLELQFFNPGRMTEISLRIDDDGDCSDYANRFTKRLAIAPGEQRVTVPVAEIARGGGGRPINLKAVRFMYLFFSPEESPHEVEFKGAKLTN